MIGYLFEGRLGRGIDLAMLYRRMTQPPLTCLSTGPYPNIPVQRKVRTVKGGSAVGFSIVEDLSHLLCTSCLLPLPMRSNPTHFSFQAPPKAFRGRRFQRSRSGEDHYNCHPCLGGRLKPEQSKTHGIVWKMPLQTIQIYTRFERNPTPNQHASRKRTAYTGW